MSKKQKQIEFLGQCESTPIEDMINEVITLKEACKLLDVAESTLRTRVLKGEFQPWECRKADTIILFSKKAILLRSKSFRLRAHKTKDSSKD